MQKRSLVVAIALVGAFSAGWGVAQGKNTPSLTGQDYSEIQQLIARYNQGLDLEDLDMYAAIFTEDAVWRGSNAQALVGREAMVESVKQRISARPREHERRHWQNNSVITRTADGATARTYFVSFEVSYQPPRTVFSGYYDDLLVKTSDGWRIKERSLTVDEPLR